jgi:inosose dehydratase
MTKTNRRLFIKSAGTGLLASTLLPSVQAMNIDKPHSYQQPSVWSLKLGLASYTTREFSLDETIKICVRMGLKYIGLKSFHLPLTSTTDECKAASQKIKNAGLEFYSVGVITMNTKEDVDQAFTYARAAGVKMINSSPAHELLGYIEDKVQKNEIQLSIHNHGPGDKLFPTVASIYEKIAKLDVGIGICMDIGHTVRLNRDPVADFNSCFDRIIDLHIKDVDKREAAGDSVEMGRGVIDLPAFLRNLSKQKYQGVAAFEYEKDAKDPVPGLAESVGYTRGILATV